MPRFLVTVELLLKTESDKSFGNERDIIFYNGTELVYENYEIIADDTEEAKAFAYKEYYFKYCYNGAETITPDRAWVKAETIKLHSGKGSGKGGARNGAGRKKGSGSKYSEPTKAMKVPTRFDGKISEVVEMSDDLKAFLNNWEEALQPMEDGHFSERKKLARRMLDDLKAVCEVLNEIPEGE